MFIINLFQFAAAVVIIALLFWAAARYQARGMFGREPNVSCVAREFDTFEDMLEARKTQKFWSALDRRYSRVVIFNADGSYMRYNVLHMDVVFVMQSGVTYEFKTGCGLVPSLNTPMQNQLYFDSDLGRMMMFRDGHWVKAGGMCLTEYETENVSK